MVAVGDQFPEGTTFQSVFIVDSCIQAIWHYFVHHYRPFPSFLPVKCCPPASICQNLSHTSPYRPLNLPSIPFRVIFGFIAKL